TDGTYSVAPPYDPSRITSTLEGQYCDIVHEDGPDPLFERTDVHSGDVVDWAWDATLYGAAAHVHAPSVYYHINYIHDYYKVLDPSFTGLDYAVPTNVGRSGYNNAYWDGTGMTFGGGDGVNYLDFGLFSEVVYHEYTHGVTDKIYTGISFPYAMEPGAMNEGWSDYFGCELSLSELSKVGDGGLIPSQPNGFRNLTNTDRRETDWVNEVHYDSEMFSAGLWEARASLGSTLMEELVHFARYRHATDFEGYLTAILLEDDVRYGDSDLTNGAPHGQAIYTGFGNHGIGGLQYQWQSLVVNDSSGNGNAKLDPGETVSLSLTLANGWANATNVQATLASADPYVTISKATANFGSVLRGGTANNSADTFTISVLPTCPETHTVNFTLTLTAQGPYSYTRTCLIYASVAVGQLAYDDGAADSGLGYGLSGAGLAVRMTPDAYPCYITHVRLWPRSSATTTLKVWDDNGTNGSPSTVLGSKSVTLSSADTWVDVDISSLNINVTSGSVYVGWVDGSAMYANGLDCDPSYYIRSWAYSGTSWSQIESAGFLGNMMVRARFSGVSPLQIIPPYAYDWIVGLPASGSLATSNGTAPFSWSVAAGALPPGVGLDSATGSFTGSPTAGGTYTATIQVTDSSSTVRQGVHEFTFSVGGPPPVPFNPHPADGATDVPVNTMLSWECQATGGEIIDDFEDGSLSEYTILGGTHDVIGAAAHDGNFGLSSSSSAWIYRADPGAVLSQGDTVSYWVLLGSSAGRAYCGFGASANGTYSAVAAPNTSTFKIQINQSYNYADLASASQSWVDNHWYRIEVQWDTGGLITARLFDSDGASLLNTISATNNTYTSGGIAFRGFGAPNYFDTVTRGAGGPVSGTTYDVYMGPSCDNLSLIASNLNQPTYDPPVDLQAGTTYHWKVVAKNSYGNTEGPCWSFTTGSILPPAPTNPSPPDGSLNNHLDVDLSWGGGGTAELIVNGDFETGDFTGWTQANTGLGSFSINNGTFDPAGPDGPLPPFAGNYSALSVPTGPGVLSIYQDISIPLGASSALLTWVDRIRNHHTAFVDPNQEYRVEIRNTQNVLLAQAFSTNPGNPLFSDWTARSFDLSAFAGSTVRVAFVTQVQYYFMNAHLDNVSVQINTGAPAGLTYDVYFGTNPIPGPGEFKGNTPTTSWELPVLESDTLYYWKVVAKNAGAEASGPVWSFRTGAVAPVPSDPIPPDDAIDVPVSTSLSWNGGGSLGVQNSGASLLINGGFETGDFTGWTVVTGPGNQFQPWTLATAGSGNWFHNGIPSEGLRFAQNGFDGAAGLYYDIYQEVAIPSAATSALLVWSERLQWNTTYGATVARPYTVTLQPAGGGAPLATLFSTTLPPGTTGDTGYVAHSINLLSVAPGAAGQTVRINFHESIPESNKGPAQFDLDGVSLTVVEGGSTTYDVYMGPSCDNLSLIASNLNQPTYDPPGNLQAAMTYHWKVVAKNAFGNTEGPCWSFTTGLATTPVANLAALKAKAGTGETVQLTGNVTVTCKNSGLFFVGEQSYKGCIKVIGADVVATGEHVTNLIGIVTVDSYGQYTITLSAPVSPAATGNAIKTVGVNNKSAKTDAKLLTNLVRVWGLVSGATITDGYIAPITVINPALGAGVIVVSGVLWREGGDVVLYQNLP
ncbi:MAG: putative Ig domain-containing protein, partial [Armatimonadetes bacterium]|nr:putative Ig domain-containing protein [Armatimonadota bacterium]